MKSRYVQARAFLLLLCTGYCTEMWLFLRKSRTGIGHFVYTRSENALAEPSIFGGLFFYVIDDQHGRCTPLLLQFQPELLAGGVE